MDFGVGVVSAVDSWKVAQRAEALGFSHVWFADTQLICADVFVAMALTAEKTSRIRLGTGVLVPTNRIAPVAAAAIASLSRLAPRTHRRRRWYRLHGAQYHGAARHEDP